MEYSKTFVVQDNSGIHTGPAGRIYEGYEKAIWEFEDNYGEDLGLKFLMTSSPH